MDNVPVTVGPAGVVVDSHTIAPGAAPTTVVVNGKPIVVGPSQISSPRTTIPLIINQPPPPTSSLTIDNVPVVVRPNEVVVNGETFTPGPAARTIVAGGKLFELDSTKFSSPTTQIDLPKAAGAPAVALATIVTVGGQEFRVGGGQVQAPGFTIPLPTANAQPTPFVFEGQNFQVNPSQIIYPGRNIDVPVGQPGAQGQVAPSHAIFVIDGQTLTVDGSRFVGPSTTVAIPGGSGKVVFNGQTLEIANNQAIAPSTTVQLIQTPDAAGITPPPSPVTVAGGIFSLGPSAAIIGSVTYNFLPGQAPTTIVDQDKTFTLGPGGVQVDGTTIPIPTPPPQFQAITAGDLIFSVAPSQAVIAGKTFPIGPDVEPILTVINGQTVSIGPQGIGLASTTVALPNANSQPTNVVTAAGLTFSLSPSEAVVDGKTFKITPGTAPITTVLNGQTITIGPQGIGLPTTTIPLPNVNSQPTNVVTAAGLTFSLSPSEAVVDGKTFKITPGSTPITTVLNGQTISIGPQGIGLATTTIPIPNANSQPTNIVTAAGLTFSLTPSEAIVDGKTFKITPGSTPITTVLNGQTISIGPQGIGLATTTIPIPNANSQPTNIVTAAGLTFSLTPSEAVVDGKTFKITPGSTPITTVLNGQTISIGPQGIGLATTTIPLPNANSQPTNIVTAAGLTFSLTPSEAIVDGKTFKITPGSTPITTVLNGQTISIGPQGIGLATTTIPLPNANSQPTTVVTAAGLTFSLSPSEAVVDGKTFRITPGSTPLTTVLNGQTITIGPNGIGLATTTIPLPRASEPTFSTVTAGGLTFFVGPSAAVIDGKTFTIGPGSSPITTVINGQTISIGPNGVGLATTTVALPQSFSTVTAGGLTFSVGPSAAVIAGHTFSIGPNTPSTTTVINGQTISIGPNGIGLATTTIALPKPTYSIVTEGDLTFSLSPSQAVISGKTFSIGPGSVPITTTINGEVVTIGPSGIIIAGTTAGLISSATKTISSGADTTGGGRRSTITVDGLTFTVEPTDVIISGTTYPIGIGAIPTTIVIGNETISIGPGGVGLPTTTIPVPPPSGSATATAAATRRSVGSSLSTSSVNYLISALLAAFITCLIWI